MPKYCIWTIGCQMNKAESERVGAGLEQLGYQTTRTPKEANLVVVNSCVVRQSAEERVVSQLNYLQGIKNAHPDLSIVLTGCIVDSKIDELRKHFPQVDFFFKPGAHTDLLEWVARQEKPVPDREEALLSISHYQPAKFVPIIQGCNNFCSYCIVPYRRGRERSRTMDEIVHEITELVGYGVKEVTLLGQNVDSYGHDLTDKPELADLLIELNRLSGLARIRFLTNHPKDMNPKLIRTISSLDKVCAYINLPVQSGDDNILKSMSRGYTVEQYRALIKHIRREIPEVALSTDVIVGFPGESEEQFKQTVDLLLELRFDNVHVAPYSPRPGTVAARMLADDIPPPEKERRRKIVEEVQEAIATEINSQLRGTTLEILVEEKKKGKWQGRTRTNKLVFFSDNAELLGQSVRVKIEKTSPWSLQGKLVAIQS